MSQTLNFNHYIFSTGNVSAVIQFLQGICHPWFIFSMVVRIYSIFVAFQLFKEWMEQDVSTSPCLKSFLYADNVLTVNCHFASHQLKWWLKVRHVVPPGAKIFTGDVASYADSMFRWRAWGSDYTREVTLSHLVDVFNGEALKPYWFIICGVCVVQCLLKWIPTCLK